MLNPIAEQLIHDLRFDDHTREHFDIGAWEGKGTCGTVGCIAGTAIALEHRFVEWGNFKRQAVCLKRTYASEGARVLGLSERVADQLFVPVTCWFEPLWKNILFEEYSHNERPSDQYIDELKQWAKEVDIVSCYTGNCTGPDFDKYTPSICAHALEQVTKYEQPYVDWKRAFELGEAV